MKIFVCWAAYNSLLKRKRPKPISISSTEDWQIEKSISIPIPSRSFQSTKLFSISCIVQSNNSKCQSKKECEASSYTTENRWSDFDLRMVSTFNISILLHLKITLCFLCRSLSSCHSSVSDSQFPPLTYNLSTSVNCLLSHWAFLPFDSIIFPSLSLDPALLMDNDVFSRCCVVTDFPADRVGK